MFRACFGRSRLPVDDAQDLQGRTSCDAGPQPAGPCICQPSPPQQDEWSCSDAKQTSLNCQPKISQKSVASGTSLKPADTASGLRSRIDAMKLHEMDAENVVVCDAAQIMEGLRLKQHELGRGTYGIVVTGTYRGVSCAVKVMLSAGLDRAALRELLLGPTLVHPNIVSTFTSRAAHLTNEFFDLLEGCRCADEQDPDRPRVLEPVPIQSGDGFGEPQGLNEGLDPLHVLHQLLHALGAETGKMVVIVVQEYCDRGTLDNAIRKQIFEPNPQWGLRLARRTLLRTAGEVARGLLHLHAGGVLHGDLKPANILLQSSREDRRGFVAKLADFGLSHVLPDSATARYTGSWGSVAYMAPESFSGMVSRATDVWAFGVCLWEMLTGQRPYMGMQQHDVIRGLQEDSLKLVWPDEAPMTAPIIELGRRCLSHNQNLRPTFDEIAEQLVAIERAIRAELVGTAAAAAVPSSPLRAACAAEALEPDVLTA